MIELSNPDKIAILTDSCADLSEELRAGKPIYTVPLKIACRDGEYFDVVDIFAPDIYRRLEAVELPKTSLPDFFTADRILSRIKAEGYERVLAIHLSSGLSGTYNMVRLLGESRSDLEIAVFDSLSGALGMGVSVLQAWEDIDNGMSWDELVKERVPRLLANTFPFFSVDTLEYLSKGGRIGKVAAFAGTLLSIKPVISFASDGQLQSVAKVRGRRQVQDKILELMEQHIRPGVRYNLGIANGGAPEEMAEFAVRMKERFPDAVHMWEGEIDATLSVYIGDGVLGGGIQILED